MRARSVRAFYLLLGSPSSGNPVAERHAEEQTRRQIYLLNLRRCAIASSSTNHHGWHWPETI